MKTIVNDIEIVRSYVPAVNAISYNEDYPTNYLDFLLPQIKSIERGFLKKQLLGESLYNELLNYANGDNINNDYGSDSGSGSANGSYNSDSGSGSGIYSVSQNNILLEQLKELCEEVVSNLAVLKWTYQASVKLSTSGMHRTESEGIKNAYHYQILEARKEYKETGYDAALEVWEFLERNKLEPVFESWKSFDGYTKRLNLFINSPKNFIYKKQIDYLVYTNLINYMLLIEDTYITAYLGKAFFSELKTQITTNTLTDHNKAVLPYLHKAISYISAALYAEQSGLEIGDKGFFFVNIESGSENIKTQKQATGIDLYKLTDIDRETGINYLKQLRQFLHENISNYATYKNSNVYSETRIDFNKAKKIVPIM